MGPVPLARSGTAAEFAEPGEEATMNPDSGEVPLFLVSVEWSVSPRKRSCSPPRRMRRWIAPSGRSPSCATTETVEDQSPDVPRTVSGCRDHLPVGPHHGVDPQRVFGRHRADWCRRPFATPTQFAFESRPRSRRTGSTSPGTASENDTSRRPSSGSPSRGRRVGRIPITPAGRA